MSSLGRLILAVTKVNKARNAIFGRHLFITNLGISVTLSGLSDLIVQNYMIKTGEMKKWDSTRTRDMTLTGLPIGFVCHHTYRLLDSFIPGRTLRAIISKVLIDQIVFSPISITVFFLSIGLLEKSSLGEIKEEILAKGKYIYFAEWVVWPPAQLINFYFLPNKYRVLYDNTISLGYDIYSSHIKFDAKLHKD